MKVSYKCQFVLSLKANDLCQNEAVYQQTLMSSAQVWLCDYLRWSRVTISPVLYGFL